MVNVGAMNSRRYAAALAALGLVLAAIPIPSAHCPAWTVTAVEPSGNTVAGVTVRLSYTNYSAEGVQHEMDRTTDETGQAVFPPQTLYASALRRAYYTVLSACAGVHASFGPSAYVFGFGKGMEGHDVDPKGDILVFWHGQPSRMASRIVMKPVSFR